MDTIRQRLHKLLEGLRVSYGVRCKYSEPMSYPAVVNDESLFRSAHGKFAADEIEIVKPFMMAEDFSNYQRQIPGLYTFVGIGEGQDTPPLHASNFDFNEQALLNGVEYFLRVTDFE